MLPIYRGAFAMPQRRAIYATPRADMRRRLRAPILRCLPRAIFASRYAYARLLRYFTLPVLPYALLRLLLHASLRCRLPIIRRHIRCRVYYSHSILPRDEVATLLLQC